MLGGFEKIPRPGFQAEVESPLLIALSCVLVGLSLVLGSVFLSLVGLCGLVVGIWAGEAVSGGV